MGDDYDDAGSFSSLICGISVWRRRFIELCKGIETEIGVLTTEGVEVCLLQRTMLRLDILRSHRSCLNFVDLPLFSICNLTLSSFFFAEGQAFRQFLYLAKIITWMTKFTPVHEIFTSRNFCGFQLLDSGRLRSLELSGHPPSTISSPVYRPTRIITI